LHTSFKKVKIKVLIAVSFCFLYTQSIKLRKNLRCDQVKKGKDIPVTGHGGPLGCKRLRFPHYLDKRLIDGGEVWPCKLKLE
jgi:hypothetical protein